MDFTWIGWLGIEIPEADHDHVTQRLRDEYSCQPVFLPDNIADKYYNGFANEMIWPLFHYHPGEMNFDETNWFAYRAANAMFAQVVTSQVRSGDLVWVQDYHLMLLPMMLRGLIEKNNVGHETHKELDRLHRGIDGVVVDNVHPKHGVKIGWFLHTPFPSSEIYRILPVRREILLGILHCDLVGFHTYDYARHFLSSCTRILGLSALPNGVQFGARFVHCGTFPIGIEPSQFIEMLETPGVVRRIEALRKRFEGVKIICGVDRLDYIKGVPQKLHALEVFLQQHPEWIGKVVLVQLAIPSRGGVEEYQTLRARVNELVGRINGRFGTVEFMPIHFMHKSLTFDELCALYAISDACLVSSTRDGMNLVSYEYISTQCANHGVMILSEFAGAAQSFHGARIVNPWNIAEMATAIHEAVTMSAEERAEKHAKLFKYVSKYTSSFWGTSFVSELKRIKHSHDSKDAHGHDGVYREIIEARKRSIGGMSNDNYASGEYSGKAAKPPQKPAALTGEQEEKYDLVLTAMRQLNTLPMSENDNTPAGISGVEERFLTRECMLRYLRATRWNTVTTIERLQKTLIWRRTIGLNEGGKLMSGDYIAPEQLTGKQLLCGFDNLARPLWYMKPDRQNTEESTRQTDHAFFMLELAKICAPRGVETVSLLINYAKKAKGPSLATSKGVLYALADHYPETLGTAFVINLPAVVTWMFKIISPLLDPVTREKLSFSNDVSHVVDKSQLEDSFGGNVDLSVYDHDKYWSQLMDFVDERKRKMSDKWIELGGGIGVSEWDIKSFDGEWGVKEVQGQ
ncbi:hypothetical protein E3P86_02721 [Wallemia ichthyophaga]|uniref:alpha,alpha-trehalose-phosphate synthase (UDP-forming) n=1 Tax=Wallemia ichthyophaga TaxID=245174 RepID=A0A4V4M4Y1_WALIC|nr:hypothetical protein E3P86_02721 [Wallemia ichthyophaga]